MKVDRLDSQFLRVIFSPHPDDVALSCSALVTGALVIVPFSESRCGFGCVGADTTVIRLAEDRRAVRDILRAKRLIHLGLPDSSKRDRISIFPDGTEGCLFSALIEKITAFTAVRNIDVFAPMAYGGHVDHLLTRFAVTYVFGGQVLHYLDQPYASEGGFFPSLRMGWKKFAFDAVKKAQALREYDSQMSGALIESMVRYPEIVIAP